jgi:hypothetical protein
MGHFLMKLVPRMFLAGSVLAGVVYGQAPVGQSPASSTSASPSSLMGAAEMAPAEPSEVAADVPDTTPDTAVDPASLLPDLPALPSHKTSLIGGTIEKLDRVRDEFTVRVFGGGKMKIYFDPRTHIYKDGSEASVSELRPGDRVYVDTILNGSNIFARNIRLKTAGGGESQGRVMSYRADQGELIVRDALSPQPLKLRLTPQTRIIDHGRAVAANQLVPGALVAVKFGAQQDGHDLAREVTVLATPGASFTFAGRVTGLDLSTGILTLLSATDGKSYDIYLDSSTAAANDKLHQAADVTVVALFDGGHYVARSLTVN